MQGAPSALEKAGAKTSFYALYAAGQRGLGDPQFIGRSAHAAMIHHGEEAANILHIHAYSASISVIFHILHMLRVRAG